MRLRVIVFALVATAVAVGLVVPSAGAKPKPVKPGQFVTYTCATGERAESGTVAWFDKDGRVISISMATAAGAATLTAGPAPARARSYEFRSVVCSPPNIHLTGSLTYPTDGEPRFLYVVDNSDAAIFGVPSCPSASTTLDYAASTIVVPNDVSLINQLDSTGSLILLLPYIDLDPDFNGVFDERTVRYDFVCVPA